MKNILSILFALLVVCNFTYAQLPTAINNSLSISIDSGFLQINGLNCDKCALSEKGFEICTCRSACTKILDKCESSELWEECEDRWDWESSNNDTYASLIDECCPEYNNCLQKCGEPLELIREPSSYSISYEIWYTNGFVEDIPNDTPDETFSTNILQGHVSNTSIKLKNPPESTFGYCYDIIVISYYEDGFFCVYKDSGCATLG